MLRPRLTLEIFLVAMAMVLLEVSYTRIFSYKLVYFFTYVVIGLALLGLGSGGVLVSLLRPERRIGTARLLAGASFAGALAVGIGYLVIATVQVNAFSTIPRPGAAGVALVEVAKLALISGALFAPFLCAGLVITVVLASDPERIGRLYFADLLGAALACAICIPLMTWLTPIGGVMIAGLLLALAGIRQALIGMRALAAPLAVLAVALVVAATAGPARLPEVVVDGTKSMNPKDRPPVLFSQWSPVFRVDVLASPLFAHVGHALVHDGMWGSILPRHDEGPEASARLERDARALPFAVTRAHPRVTIIGAAGGSEVLTALHLEAEHVTGVELNGVTVSLLTTSFKDYTGGFADDPRVRLVNAEGRAYFDGTTERSDLVWFVAPDSYAAMNAAMSGAFVLSESYLYTAEMLETAFARLAPGGIVCAQFGEIRYEEKPNRTTRYVTTAREAFRRLGITDFPRHVLVVTSPGFAFTTSTILLRREPFTRDDAARLAAAAQQSSSRVRFDADTGDADHPVTAAVTLPDDELARWYATYPWDVRPVTDDKPFFWHFLPFRAAFRAALTPGAQATEEGLGERLLIVLAALLTAFAAVASLAPLLLRRAVWRTIPHKLAAGTYFAAIGLGFMLLEIALIQRLTLFLGYPTHSLTVTLFALLLSTALGSLASERAVATRDRSLAVVGIALTAIVVAHLVGLGPLMRLAAGASFPLRIVVAILAVAPLGICMGFFMPLGLRTVAALSPHATEYVAWAWAVNGFFTVVATVTATMLAMSFGFRTAMMISLALYAIAITALRRIPAPAS